jgi:hypothetical protein
VPISKQFRLHMWAAAVGLNTAVFSDPQVANEHRPHYKLLEVWRVREKYLLPGRGDEGLLNGPMRNEFVSILEDA